MSAVEEYRESPVMWPNSDDPLVYKNRADAAIAELEAENEKNYRKWQDEILRRAVAEGRAEQAEAELAALKGRRCDGCHWLEEVDSRGWNHCKKLGDWEPPDFACNRWAERRWNEYWGQHPECEKIYERLQQAEAELEALKAKGRKDNILLSWLRGYCPNIVLKAEQDTLDIVG